MVELARISLLSPEVRGPDGTWSVAVEAEWLGEGATVELTVPLKVRCAACDGGGCDVCGRSGAIETSHGAAPEKVVVHLAPGDSGPRGVRLRGHGGATPALDARGDLVVTLLPSPQPSAAAKRIRPAGLPRQLWGAVVVLLLLALGAYLVTRR